MTQGVLLFAYNNTDIDYIELAVIAAKRIQQHLELPVSIVIDNESVTDSRLNIFDKILTTEVKHSQKKRFYDGIDYKLLDWKNFTRSNAYSLTPYDETLVLDVDYLVCSKFLKNCFNTDKDFLIFKKSYDLAEWRGQTAYNYINDYSTDFYWATVFYFKKTPWTELFFSLVAYIKNNWDYYRNLYQVSMPNYRNDISFSIALNILNGFDSNNFVGTIPNKLYYVADRDYLIKINDTDCTFLIQKEDALNEYTVIKTENLDIHVMNKSSILRVCK